MDEKIYNLITIALNVIFIYHVVIGFLLGFKRGAVNASFRLVTLILSVIVAVVLVAKINFGGMNLLSRVKNLINKPELNEVLDPILQNSNSESAVNFLINLVSIIFGGLFF